MRKWAGVDQEMEIHYGILMEKMVKLQITIT